MFSLFTFDICFRYPKPSTTINTTLHAYVVCNECSSNRKLLLKLMNDVEVATFVEVFAAVQVSSMFV